MLAEPPLLSVEGTMAGKEELRTLNRGRRGRVGICPVDPKTKLIGEGCLAYPEGRLREETRDFPEVSRGPSGSTPTRRKSEDLLPEQPACPRATGNLKSCAAAV